MDRSLTRRGAITAIGGALTALAGCSFGSAGTDYDERALREIGQRPIPEPSAQFPFSVSESMIARHRDRATALLERVPETASVPNELIAASIESEREELAERFSGGDDAENSDDEGEEQPTPRRRLFDWRRNRVDAATLLGRYRAATGDISRSSLRERRDTIRSARADFVASHEYHGEDPTSAVFANEVLETAMRSVARELEPYPPFPDEPTDDPDEVGYLVGKLERGEARLTETRRYRGQLPDGGTSYRPAMMATATWLRRRARTMEHSLERYFENGLSAFDTDVSGTPAEFWFRSARDVATEYSNSDLLDTVGEESYASAVIEAGQRRAALSTLETVVEEIEGGTYSTQLSTRELRSLRERAVSNVESSLAADNRFSQRFVESAIGQVRDGSQQLRSSGSSGEPVNRAVGRFAYAESQAEQAAKTGREVEYLLGEAAE